MEFSQSQQSLHVPSSKASLLRQHPVSPSFPPNTPDATQTIFLSHPTARISSSPASSPRIVDPPPQRRDSVRPAMSETMQTGLRPGFDFFDDRSSGSEWEDSDGDVTQTFSEMNGLSLRSLVPRTEKRSRSLPRGRSREMSGLTALPPFHASCTDYSSPAFDDERASRPANDRDPRKARTVSLTRLDNNKIHLIHNNFSAGTPRSSLRSFASDAGSPIAERKRPFAFARTSEPPQPKGTTFHGRHRSNTSGSLIADSIIDAHATTMRALEALTLSPSRNQENSQSRTYLNSESTMEFPKLPSFTAHRHITIPPLSTEDHNRPAHLPSHFIKTPYPFTAKKEFPKPESRPRQKDFSPTDENAESDLTRLDSGYGKSHKKEYNNRKGKHVLGLVTTDGELDLRSRLVRNEDAQGVIRSRSESCREASESVVWLGIRRHRLCHSGADQVSRRLTKIVVPSSLTTSGAEPTRNRKQSVAEMEFDDKFFAEQLRATHQQLAGSWIRRLFSARKLQRIQLGRICAWSGASSSHRDECMPGLLSIGEGVATDSDTVSPFTEDGLMKLYDKPATGQARYTWVHWARRVAISNNDRISSGRSSSKVQRHARSPNSPSEKEQGSGFSASSDDLTSASPPDVITMVQFVHSLSTSRILIALALMLLVSVAAILLWVFVGTAGTGSGVDSIRQRSERVGPAMAIGIVVLLIESLGFAAWVWLS